VSLGGDLDQLTRDLEERKQKAREAQKAYEDYLESVHNVAHYGQTSLKNAFSQPLGEKMQCLSAK
jgi:hypothetical protein